jgi:hypothetical protein
MTRRKANKVVASSRLDATPFCPTIADCKRWTEVLNYIMFQGQIPKYREITVRPMRKAYAWCHGKHDRRGKKYCNLEVDIKFDSFAAFYSILAHELCHAAEWHEMEDINHGNFFYSHREMLEKIGIKLRRCY